MFYILTFIFNLGWCLCPCLFCTECTIGAIASSSSSIITNSFDYKNLKPNTIHKNTLWKTIFQFDKFNRHVGEAEGNRQYIIITSVIVLSFYYMI